MDFSQYSLGAQLCNCCWFLASLAESKYVAEKLTLIVMNYAVLLVGRSQLSLVIFVLVDSAIAIFDAGKEKGEIIA